MAYSTYDYENQNYSSCCMYDPCNKMSCGKHDKSIDLIKSTKLNNHFYATDGSVVAKELQLLTSRCKIDETKIKSICPKHRLKYGWENDKKMCEICFNSSHSKSLVRAGINASIDIRKNQSFKNFPIRKFVDKIVKNIIITSIIIICSWICVL